MRSRSLSVLLLTFSCLGSQIAPAASPDVPSTGDGASAVTPKPQALDAAVEFALRMELEGRNTDRNSLLLKVLEDDQEHAAAHWHLGQIKVGEEWLPYDRVIHEDGDRWHLLYLYRQNRDERKDTIDDHFYLADGAHERGMWDEERAQLMRIVELDWDNAEARRRLGDQLVDGFWVTREEVDQFLRTMLETRAHLDEWTPRVQPIVDRLQRSRRQAWDQARDELFAIRDPAAIPAVETALAGAGDDGASLYLDWLSRLDAWEASVALARQAVYSPSAAVRARSQLLLKERRIDDYAPVLLSCIRTDPESQAASFVTPLGGLMYVQQMRIESQYEVRTVNLSVIYGPEELYLPRSQISWLGEEALLRNPDLMKLAMAHLHAHYRHAFSAGTREAAYEISIGNNRVERLLGSVLEHSDLTTPEDCWQWWSQYQQVYSDQIKTELQRDYEETWAVDRQRGVVRTPKRAAVIRTCSCFAAGTPVVTEYGPKPIEEIRLGDRVLAQDVETGEIAFKPVFKTTVRPPVELVKITTKAAELVCTPGHPFWVNDHDWLYARELEPRMRFHSIMGGEEITAVEDAGRKEQAYNLIVADFHTYFAGDARVLSHDNTPRNPTDALVPGLMPDWSADPQDDAVAEKQ